MSDIQNIDVALLRAFIAVAETGRMTTAAKIVHRTQGAISQQIKRLETQFDARLFDRKAGSASLTREGEKLLVNAHRLISLNDEIMDRMRTVDFTGEVRLGVAHDIVRAMMPPVLRRFRQEHPNVLTTLMSDTTQTLRADLRERKIDLAILTESERGDRDQFLLTDQLIWVGAKGGDAHRRRPLSVALGQENCGFRAAAIKALTKARMPWRASRPRAAGPTAFSYQPAASINRHDVGGHRICPPHSRGILEPVRIRTRRDLRAHQR